MSMSDPIADMLTRIRNANTAKHDTVAVSYTHLIGRPAPMTPWGKPAMGYKTRNKHKASNKYIVRRRNG